MKNFEEWQDVWWPDWYSYKPIKCYIVHIDVYKRLTIKRGVLDFYEVNKHQIYHTWKECMEFMISKKQDSIIASQQKLSEMSTLYNLEKENGFKTV